MAVQGVLLKFSVDRFIMMLLIAKGREGTGTVGFARTFYGAVVQS